MIDPQTRLVITETSKKLIIQDNKKTLVFNNSQGLPGPDGTVVSAICGETVVAGDVLYFKNDGKLYLADKDDAFLQNSSVARFVIATNDCLANSSVPVKFSGIFTFATSSFLVGAFYYLGNGGQITPIPPTSGLLVMVGQTLSTTQIFIEFSPPILLRG